MYGGHSENTVEGVTNRIYDAQEDIIKKKSRDMEGVMEALK